MKRLAELTAEDLLGCRVWEYQGSGDASALVRPSNIVEIHENREAGTPVYIALTEFVLANGDRHVGFTSPADPSGLDYVQPVMVLDGQHLALWSMDGGVPEGLCSRLALEQGNVFPITWRCLVPVDGQALTGRIPE